MMRVEEYDINPTLIVIDMQNWICQVKAGQNSIYSAWMSFLISRFFQKLVI